ncbi:MAG: hypothetical protein WBA92_15600, partial [Pseudorhodobacter sp.]
MDELEFLITVAGLAVLIFLVLIPYLFFSHLGLKSKVRKLEQLAQSLQAELARLAQGQAPASAAPAKAAAAQPDPKVSAAQTPAQAASTAQTPEPQPWP